MSLHKNGNKIIVLMERRISLYIEILPQPHVNYVEENLGVYSIFLEEDDDSILISLEPKDKMWDMHFDGFCSNEGNRVGIIL
jgi:hypothetical protein